MKPFNLEEFKSGKPAVTRDGKSVIFGAHNPKASKLYRVIGWIENEFGVWDESGNQWYDSKSDRDLFMATEKKTVWVNVYTDSLEVEKCGYFISRAYTSESLAWQESQCWVNGFDRKYIGTYPIEIEV